MPAVETRLGRARRLLVTLAICGIGLPVGVIVLAGCAGTSSAGTTMSTSHATCNDLPSRLADAQKRCLELTELGVPIKISGFGSPGLVAILKRDVPLCKVHPVGEITTPASAMPKYGYVRVLVFNTSAEARHCATQADAYGYRYAQAVNPPENLPSAARVGSVYTFYIPISAAPPASPKISANPDNLPPNSNQDLSRALRLR